jgi:hypothetical protein
VYSAHLSLVEEAYRAADTAHLGPARTSDNIMGRDGYRMSLLFQAGMPELRNDHSSNGVFRHEAPSAVPQFGKA